MDIIKIVQDDGCAKLDPHCSDQSCAPSGQASTQPRANISSNGTYSVERSTRHSVGQFDSAQCYRAGASGARLVKALSLVTHAEFDGGHTKTISRSCSPVVGRCQESCRRRCYPRVVPPPGCCCTLPTRRLAGCGDISTVRGFSGA